MFPADPVSMGPPSPLAVRDDALREAVELGRQAAVRGGQQAAGVFVDLTAAIENLNLELQQLREVNQNLLNEMRHRRPTNSYTLICNITLWAS